MLGAARRAALRPHHSSGSRACWRTRSAARGAPGADEEGASQRMPRAAEVQHSQEDEPLAGGAARRTPESVSLLLSASLDEDAAAANMASSWGAVRPRTTAHRVLSVVNESTKWVVSGIVFAVLVAAHNEWAAWTVVGAVLSSFLCKVLKHVINEQRPASARKKDPGMPSSHSNSLNFLSVYAALSLKHHAGAHAATGAAAAATVAAGLFLTWLRVALGFHTWPQVAVGALLGASTAAAWFHWGTAAAVPALRASPGGLPALYAATLIGMAAFGVRNVLAWAAERREAAAARAQKARASDGGWDGSGGVPAPAAG